MGHARVIEDAIQRGEEFIPGAVQLRVEVGGVPQQALISFYRDDKAKEIDVFVEENGKIHPLEIKMSANPDKKETRKFDVIEKTTLSRGKGGIVCMVQHPFPLNADDLLIPSNLI